MLEFLKHFEQRQTYTNNKHYTYNNSAAFTPHAIRHKTCHIISVNCKNNIKKLCISPSSICYKILKTIPKKNKKKQKYNVARLLDGETSESDEGAQLRHATQSSVRRWWATSNSSIIRPPRTFSNLYINFHSSAIININKRAAAGFVASASAATLRSRHV